MSVFAVAFALFFSRATYNETDYLNLDNGWKVQINDETHEDVKISDFIFPVLNKGDSLTMSCNISDDVNVENPVLVIYSIHSVVEVCLDGENIYNYGQELFECEELLGYGYHYVNISDFAGKSIEISLKISEDDAFSSMEIPKICNSASYFRDFIIKNKVPLAVNMFLIIFGIFIVFISTVFCFKNKKFFKLFCIGGFSLSIGCWSLCNYDLISLFSYDLRIKVYMEFISLYIAPIFVFLYFWKDKFFTRNKFAEMFYKLIVAALTVFLGVAFVLQFANVVHFPAMLRIFHVILIAFGEEFVFLMVHDIVKGKLKNKTLALGMAVMILVAFSDVLRFSIFKYTVATGNVSFTNNICVGALLLVIAQLVEFYTEITDVFMKGVKVQVLEQMAYIDSLTNVANRRQCEMFLDELDKGTSNYGIFSFDLNNLKVTNDTKGHEAGDFLLRTFADILTDTFAETGMVGRTGGDEFIVILPDTDGIDVDKLICSLEKNIEITNKENTDINLSTAYGFCSYAQLCEHDARKVYKVADERMYEHKLAMKAAGIRY